MLSKSLIIPVMIKENNFGLTTKWFQATIIYKLKSWKLGPVSGLRGKQLSIVCEGGAAEHTGSRAPPGSLSHHLCLFVPGLLQQAPERLHQEDQKPVEAGQKHELSAPIPSQYRWQVGSKLA